VLVSRKAGETPPVAESIRETTVNLRRDVDRRDLSLCGTKRAAAARRVAIWSTVKNWTAGAAV
jgi:hypothetical protein